MEPIVATRAVEPFSRAWRLPLGIFAAGGVFGALAALAFCRHEPPPRAVHGCRRQVMIQRPRVEHHVLVPQTLLWHGPDVRVRSYP